MAFDYSPIAATAASLLAQFGQTVTLSKITPGTYDPVTGGTTGGTTATQTASAALLDYTLQESGAKFADGSQVRVGDKKALIEAEGLAWAPDESTTLIDAAGVIWQIEKLRTLAPSGVAVLYTANATR
jgi:hypothetical protein